jgi:hypothetical protein
MISVQRHLDTRVFGAGKRGHSEVHKRAGGMINDSLCKLSRPLYQYKLYPS